MCLYRGNYTVIRDGHQQITAHGKLDPILVSADDVIEAGRVMFEFGLQDNIRAYKVW